MPVVANGCCHCTRMQITHGFVVCIACGMLLRHLHDRAAGPIKLDAPRGFRGCCGRAIVPPNHHPIRPRHLAHRNVQATGKGKEIHHNTERTTPGSDASTTTIMVKAGWSQQPRAQCSFGTARAYSAVDCRIHSCQSFFDAVQIE